jgi:DNA-binding PadR family transcriptional regulator
MVINALSVINIYISHLILNIACDIEDDNMFRIRARAYEIIDKFRAKGATSPEKALTIGELGLPRRFEQMMEGPIGFSGVFVEVEGRYYLSEERLQEIEENIASVAEGAFTHPLRHWMRYTASVPKGFLRLHVLKLLKEKTMSGSEIMEEIGRQTGGRWKPSPGSVYPLLAWLQENRFIQEIRRKKGDTRKRYKLTEKGEKFLDQQSELKEGLQKKLDFFAPPFLSEFWLCSHPKNMVKIREPAKRLIQSLLNLRLQIGELKDQDWEEIREALDNSAEMFEKIFKRLKERKKVIR